VFKKEGKMKRVKIIHLALPLFVAVSALAQSGEPLRHAKKSGYVALGPSAGSTAPFTFLPEVNYDSGGYGGQSVAVADVNGDGKLDLVVANICASVANCSNSGAGPGEVSVLLGNGNGTFQPAVSYSSGGFLALSVAIEDVNSDGKPDLIVVNECASSCVNGLGPGGVSVLINNGDGTFKAPVSYSSGGRQASSVVLGDVDGDGMLDLVVANNCQGGSSAGCSNSDHGEVSVLLGNGNGTFQPPISYDTGGIYAKTVAIGDLNGDGHPDLVVANIIDSGFTHGIIGVLLNNGDGTFKSPVSYNSVAQDAEGVAIGDVNGDGKPDLVVANGCQQTNCAQGVTVFLGKGNGTFASPVTYSSGADASYSVLIADLNGDGHPDLAVASWAPHSVGVLMGNGDGTFQAPVIYDTGTGYCCSGANSVAVGDANDDGKPDLLVANSCHDSFCSTGSVGVLLNNNGAPPTTTSLVASSNPANINQIIAYTAKVAQSGGTVNGNVAFQDGATTVATVPLANNEAKFTTTYLKLQAGPHLITAIYQGALHVAASSEAALTEYVRNAQTKTVLTTSGSPSLVGQPVTFTAKVTSSFGQVPDGELVTFYAGGKALASVALASGTASYTTTALSAASHYIRATYVGDTKFEPSTGSVTQVVNPYASTTTLTSIPNPSTFGQIVKLTATVTSGAPGGPTGRVIFKNGAIVLGTAILGAGKAVISTTKLPIGTLTLTASYEGDAKTGKSSGTTAQTVH
jgi:hypothetical protein